MAYSDFTLKSVKERFSLTTSEQHDLFTEVPEVTVSEHLQRLLQEHVPLGLAINTEKARSELIVAPILVEARRLTGRRVSLFSGIEFNVASEQGLNGVCDFIFSRSPEQLLLVAPAMMLVEAKKDDIYSALGQCIAEMVAARLYNEREGQGVTTIYGAVTTGSIWKFLKLEGSLVFVDRTEHYLERPGKILAILLYILQDGQASQALAA